MPFEALVSRLASPGGPLRYAAAGLVNTGAAYAAILGAGLAGLPPFSANALGFVAGACVNLVLAGRWTFGAPSRRGALPRHLAGFLACYAGNLVAVAAVLHLGAPALVAQGAGVCVYALSFYLTCRWWVYGDPDVARSDVRLVCGTIRVARRRA